MLLYQCRLREGGFIFRSENKKIIKEVLIKTLKGKLEYYM